MYSPAAYSAWSPAMAPSEWWDMYYVRAPSSDESSETEEVSEPEEDEAANESEDEAANETEDAESDESKDEASTNNVPSFVVTKVSVALLRADSPFDIKMQVAQVTTEVSRW